MEANMDVERRMMQWLVYPLMAVGFAVLAALFMLGSYAAKAGPNKETVGSILAGGVGR